MKRKEAIEVLETIRIGSSRTEHEAIDKAVKALKNTKKEYNRGYKDGKKDIWDDAYQTGYDDAKFQNDYSTYQHGLEDAWECAKKIAEMRWEDCERLFELAQLQNIIFDFTAQEAMQKIKDYEERQNVKKVYEEKFMPIGKANMKKRREERQTEIKCDTCKYEGSSFSPCIKCKDNSEFEPKEERQTTNLCDKCAKTKCSVKMQLEEQNIKLKGCDFYEDKESK